MKRFVPFLRQLAAVLTLAVIIGGAAGLFPGLRYVWVALFGFAIGFSELVSRYRDAPESALRTVPALIYAGVNVAASVGALRLIEIYDWLHTAGSTSMQVDAQRVLVAGFGAMAVFRSSLFLTRVGNQDVQIGPITFLQVVLGAADRAVDRLRGVDRAASVGGYMRGVNFKKASLALPPFCLALMQNLSGDDQKLLASDLALLGQLPVDDDTKSMTLGLKLMNVVGEKVLKEALAALAAQIRDTVVVTVNDGKELKLSARGEQKVVAVASDASGNAIAGKLATWKSADEGVATVDALGNVRGIAKARTTLTATIDGVAGSVPVDVS